MIMGDLGADVVEYVSFGDSVGEETTKPCKDGSGTTEELTVTSGKSTALAMDVSEIYGTCMHEKLTS